MIVPSNRLIFFFALIVPPFVALATIWAPASPIAVLIGGALAFTAMLDAARARETLREITIEMGEFTRLQKGRPGQFELKFGNIGRSRRTVRVGCILPAEITTPEEERMIELPAGTEASVCVWPCTPTIRGLFHISGVMLETASPLGLWARRERRPLRHELRVYPDLLAERQKVAGLFLRRGMTGTHSQRRAGQGREFEKLREYIPGDCLSDVHWKASAKRRHLVTKVHQIERSHEVYVVVDASRLSGREVAGQPGVTALERYVTAALILGAAAERQGDQFGLITFSDHILTFLRARAGQAHFGTCREHLYTLQPQPVTPDYEELCAFIRSRLNKRALVIFLTALDDPFLAESFIDASKLISRQHLILVNMLRPAGVRPIFQNTTGSIDSIDDVYHELAGHLHWDKLRELEGILRQRGVRFNLLDPDMISAELVQQHADVRAQELV